MCYHLQFSIYISVDNSSLCLLSVDPSGAGRVTFSSRVSFMSAVSCRFLQVTYGDIDKKVSNEHYAMYTSHNNGVIDTELTACVSVCPRASSSPHSSQVEVKPYVLDDQVCDECHGMNCCGRYAPYFCGNIHCLRYYCEHCWAAVHAAPGTQNHRCFIKENGDRPRAINFFPSQPRLLPKASLLAAATSSRH